MRKIYAALAVFCLSGASLFAQDIITTRNGEKIEVLVKEVSQDEIKYKKFSNQNGPMYVIPVDDVLMITYQNGEQDVFEVLERGQEITDFIEIAPGMKYSELKKIYNSHDYVRQKHDPHSPFWCGVGSLIFPGLGQICCDEWVRGLVFLGINVATYVMANDPNDYMGDIYSTINLVNNIWAVVDAVKVSKVINMYVQDLRMSSVDVNLYPNIAYVPSGNGLQPTAGMTLAISF